MQCACEFVSTRLHGDVIMPCVSVCLLPLEKLLTYELPDPDVLRCMSMPPGAKIWRGSKVLAGDRAICAGDARGPLRELDSSFEGGTDG